MSDWKVISARIPSLPAYLRQVAANHHLILALSRRDLQIKFAQTWLGIAWVLVQPLGLLAVMTLFFDRLLPLETGEMPYPLFAFAGIMAWNSFSYLVREAGTVLNQYHDLVKRMYFPRLVLHLSKVLTGGIDLLVALVLLLGLMLMYGYPPTWNLLALPLLLLLQALIGLSAGLWISILSVRLRDVQLAIPFLLNVGIWLTPVFYPVTLIPQAYAWLLHLNPLAGLIGWYRWCLLGAPAPDPGYAMGLGMSLLALLLGLHFFRRMERRLVDWI